MDKENKVLRFQHKVDEDVAEMYAKEKCKHCRGSGVIRTHQAPNGTIRRGMPMIESINYCSCVRKNQKKYG